MYLSKLKELVPFMPKNRRLSKLEVIQHVIDYICDLQYALETHPVVVPAASEHVTASPTVRTPLGVLAPNSNVANTSCAAQDLLHASVSTSIALLFLYVGVLKDSQDRKWRKIFLLLCCIERLLTCKKLRPYLLELLYLAYSIVRLPTAESETFDFPLFTIWLAGIILSRQGNFRQVCFKLSPLYYLLTLVIVVVNMLLP